MNTTGLFVLSCLAVLSGVSESSAASFLSPQERRLLVQNFTAAQYQKSFRYLGDENDFDHGHFLFAAGDGRPRAILYHTQEMAPTYKRLMPGGKYDYINEDGRNWIQFIDEPNRIINARTFLSEDLAAKDRRYLEYRTITDRMLDPQRLGWQIVKSVQWVFRRGECAEGLEQLEIELSGSERICLQSEQEQNFYTTSVAEAAAGPLR